MSALNGPIDTPDPTTTKPSRQLDGVEEKQQTHSGLLCTKLKDLMEHPLASALGASKQPRGDKASSVTNSNRGLIQTTMAVGVGVGRVLSTVVILVQ